MLGFVRALSLDVVLGGLAGGALALSTTRATVPAAWWPILAGAIWVIYTVDHLLDARRVGERGAEGRHRFHARTPRRLLLAAVGVAVLCVLGAWRSLPGEVFLGGAALGAAGAFHLAVSQLASRRWHPKEISVSAIYTAGIWLAPLILARDRSYWVWLVAALHFSAVLLNMMMYAVFEERLDAAEDSASLSRTVRAPALFGGIVTLTTVGLLAAGAGLLGGPPRLGSAWVVLAVLIAAPAAFLAMPRWFVPRQRYRTYGELLFLLLAIPMLIR